MWPAWFPFFHAFIRLQSPTVNSGRDTRFFSLLLDKTVFWISLDKDKILRAWNKEKKSDPTSRYEVLNLLFNRFFFSFLFFPCFFIVVVTASFLVVINACDYSKSNDVRNSV